MTEPLDSVLAAAGDFTGPRVFLTGAGISAESGIPTFRGEEGYWRVGSKHYQPQELATWGAFQQMPTEIWAWYLYRASICREAEPNPAHQSLANAEKALGDRLRLITQNVDGLHLRAGSTLERTFQIHGNVHFTRCASECHDEVKPLAEELFPWPRDRELDAGARKHLKCPQCGDWLRPHVLWFDEYYDEGWYRFESSMTLAQRCSLLIIVGTSGATNLPMQVARTATARGVPVIVIDPEPSVFSEMASSATGCFLRGPAGEHVPKVCSLLA